MNKSSTITFFVSLFEETKPIENAVVFLYNKEGILLETVKTDISGKTPCIPVDAPDYVPNYEAYESVPYETYHARIEAEEIGRVHV